MNQNQKRKAREIASKVLRRPGSSKAAKTRNGSALTMSSSPWQKRRRKPYTATGIIRLNCIRCGDPATVQWQICSDKNNYRPICTGCDVKLNRLVLKFMKHPHFGQLADEYEAEKSD